MRFINYNVLLILILANIDNFFTHYGFYCYFLHFAILHSYTIAMPAVDYQSTRCLTDIGHVYTLNSSDMRDD